jgi:ribosomal protein L11 methyltransferase
LTYTALRLDLPGVAADAWSDALLEAGALSVETTDPNAGTAGEQPLFGEPGEPSTATWPMARLVALFAQDVDAVAALNRVAGSRGEAVPGFDAWPVAEQDWVRATQAQFGPITIGGRLHVVPTWCEPPAAGAVIVLDPGLAFGTGSHPTTRLCMEWLLANLAGGETVLDYGCGSGILAIAAAKLGAARVIGTDVDPQALRASAANAAANKVAATFVAPDDLQPGTFDIVVANILANPLVLLAPAIAARVRPGGRLALAGILAMQADAVVAAYAPWFTLRAARAAEDWVLLAGERRP